MLLLLLACEAEPPALEPDCVLELTAEECPDAGTECDRCTIDREGDVPDDVWFECFDAASASKWATSNRDRIHDEMKQEPYEYDVDDLERELNCHCDAADDPDAYVLCP